MISIVRINRRNLNLINIKRDETEMTAFSLAAVHEVVVGIMPSAGGEALFSGRDDEVAGGEGVEERFEGRGAAADEAGVDFEDPMVLRERGIVNFVNLLGEGGILERNGW